MRPSVPSGARALALSIAWMMAVQLVCVTLWHVGWLSRPGALTHWLLVGVLPPALALWMSGGPGLDPADRR